MTQTTGSLSIRWLMTLGIAIFIVFVAPGWAANGIATVKDYGAIGNGVADDTVAFRNALSAERLVHVPAGSYRITQQLRIPAQGGLVGEGRLLMEFGDSSTPSTAANVGILIVGNGARIEGIVIEKKKVDGSYGTGILADQRKNITIRGVEILNYSARYGIHIVESSDFIIEDCYIHDFMMNTTADMIEDSPAGIRVTRSRDGVIANNIIKRIEVGEIGMASISPIRPSYGPQGYQSDHITLMQCRGITVTGNIMRTSGEGLDMLLSESCTVSGNVIEDIWFWGIKMLGTSFCTISGNKLADCYTAIGLEDGAASTICYGNAITGNVIRDSGSPGSFGVPGRGRVNYSDTYGIDVHGQSDYNVISENVILDTQATKTTAGGILNNGRPNNRIADNLISIGLTYSTLPITAPQRTSATPEWTAAE